MSLRSSLYISIAQQKARENYFNNVPLVRSHVQAAIENHQYKADQLAVYSFNAKRHKEMTNVHTALTSKGCGCKLCIARHVYTCRKDFLRWFENEYYSNAEEDQFTAMYLVGRESELQTEEEYFHCVKMEFQADIKDLKLRYESIKDTINHLLEE